MFVILRKKEKMHLKWTTRSHKFETYLGTSLSWPQIVLRQSYCYYGFFTLSLDLWNGFHLPRLFLDTLELGRDWKMLADGALSTWYSSFSNVG